LPCQVFFAFKQISHWHFFFIQPYRVPCVKPFSFPFKGLGLPVSDKVACSLADSISRFSIRSSVTSPLI
jgi:hypothetical protein